MPETRSFRVLYAGPGLSGRTTTITQIYDWATRSGRAKLERVDKYERWSIEATLTWAQPQAITLTLFATPGSLWYSPLYEEAARVADAIVFVVDSQVGRLDASIESLERNAGWLRDGGRDLRGLPVALQYNKRDLPQIASLEQLEREVNTGGWPSFESVARTGQGVLGPLDAVVRRLTGRDLFPSHA